tara:strand:- start:171 stop:308 length:138 start_codon:yes stop_codon:yes gene_type:complete
MFFCCWRTDDFFYVLFYLFLASAIPANIPLLAQQKKTEEVVRRMI